MVKDWSKYQNFSEEEFACKCGCGQVNVSEFLIQKLQICSDYTKQATGKRIPIIIESGCRCLHHNHEIGGSISSSHIADDKVECTAADIKIANSTQRFWILRGLFVAGFLRIGIYNDHNGIHADVDSTKDECVMWKK